VAAAPVWLERRGWPVRRTGSSVASQSQGTDEAPRPLVPGPGRPPRRVSASQRVIPRPWSWLDLLRRGTGSSDLKRCAVACESVTEVRAESQASAVSGTGAGVRPACRPGARDRERIRRLCRTQTRLNQGCVPAAKRIVNRRACDKIALIDGASLGPYPLHTTASWLQILNSRAASLKSPWTQHPTTALPWPSPCALAAVAKSSGNEPSAARAPGGWGGSVGTPHPGTSRPRSWVQCRAGVSGPR